MYPTFVHLYIYHNMVRSKLSLGGARNVLLRFYNDGMWLFLLRYWLMFYLILANFRGKISSTDRIKKIYYNNKTKTITRNSCWSTRRKTSEGVSFGCLATIYRVEFEFITSITETSHWVGHHSMTIEEAHYRSLYRLLYTHIL